jgi:lysyl-tRNA synthetase class 2
MLEWYRPGFSLEDLLKETYALLTMILGECQFRVSTYRDLFMEYLELDPMKVCLEELKQVALERAAYSGPELSKDGYLDLLISICIEPHLGKSVDGQCCPLFVCEYPASQASLAKIKTDKDGFRVAERFELYINGLEIANAYYELTNAKEQRQRFEADNLERLELGIEQISIDENLLSAMASGMPECSGIALGLDRLLMVKLNASDISEVLGFPLARV